MHGTPLSAVETEGLIRQFGDVLHSLRTSLPHIEKLSNPVQGRPTALLGALTSHIESATAALEQATAQRTAEESARTGSSLTAEAPLVHCAEATAAAIHVYGQLANHVADRLAIAEETGLAFSASALGLLANQVIDLASSAATDTLDRGDWGRSAHGTGDGP
jgi:hypothetical protein